MPFTFSNFKAIFKLNQLFLADFSTLGIFYVFITHAGVCQ